MRAAPATSAMGMARCFSMRILLEMSGTAGILTLRAQSVLVAVATLLLDHGRLQEQPRLLAGRMNRVAGDARGAHVTVIPDLVEVLVGGRFLAALLAEAIIRSFLMRGGHVHLRRQVRGVT